MYTALKVWSWICQHANCISPIPHEAENTGWLEIQCLFLVFVERSYSFSCALWTQN